MSNLNANIILQGRNPDLMNALARGQIAGAQATEIQRGNQRNALYAEQGPQIMAGETGALNALAQLDPNAALGIQNTHADNRRADAQLDIQRANGRRADAGLDLQRGNFEMRQKEFQIQLEQFQLKASDAEKTRAAAEIEAKLKEGVRYFQSGDLQSLNRILVEAGEEPVETLEEFVPVAAMYQGAFETLSNAREYSGAQDPDWRVATPEEALLYGANGGQINVKTGEFKSTSRVNSLSEAEQKIARLVEQGLDRTTAQGIVDGRFVTSRDPITGQAQVVDKATGLPVDQRRPDQLPEVGASNPQQPGTMPQTTDFSSATGASGFFSQLANTVSDALGGGLIDQNNERATQAMSNLSTRTMVTLADAVAGRPSNFLLEQFQALTVSPNSIWQGEGRTRERMNQTRDMLADAIEMNRDVQNSEVTPQMRAQAAQNIARLSRLLSDYDTVIASFGKRNPTSKSGNQTKSGVKWSVEQ